MVKIPRQNKKEIDRIKSEFNRDFYFIERKEDLIQKKKIQSYLNGDEYEEIEDDFMDEGFI